MTSSFPLGLQVAAIGGAALCLLYMQRDTRAAPPGPRPLPFIGNLLDLPRHEQWLVYEEWSRRYGSDVVHINVLGTDIIVVNSARVAATLLGQKSAIYSDRPRMPMLGELVGLGWHFGFMPHGDDWRAHRKLFAQESGASAIQDCHEQEVKWIKTLLKNIRDDPKKFMVHIQHMASGLALETTFGLQVQPSGQPDPFIAAAKQAVEALTESGLFGTYLVDFVPALKYIPSWFPYATFKRQAREWRKSSDIAAHVPYEISKKNIAANDYVPSIASKILSSDVEEDETVVRQTTAAMFANGSAAVVSALSTFILAMRLYPQVQAKAQKEIVRVISGRLPDTSDEANLPYITAVVREVGRWQPVVPLAFPHMLSADDIYEGYHLKAGSIVFPNAWAILHDPNVYPDPHVFRPERFLTADGTLNPEVKDPDAVWGFGRRACPGRKMGHSTLFGAIAAMLATFDVKPAFDENGKIIVPLGECGAGMLRYPKAFECGIEIRSADAVALISAD